MILSIGSFLVDCSPIFPISFPARSGYYAQHSGPQHFFKSITLGLTA
jgi:hypothetical protein